MIIDEKKNQEDQTMQFWFLKRGISDGTKRTYKFNMKNLCTTMNCTFLELHEKFKNVGFVIDGTQLEMELLIAFDKLKNDNKHAPKTIRQIYTTLQSYCKAYKFPCIELNLKAAKKQENIRRLLTKDELKKAMEVADLRGKAIISIGIMTGMRSVEIRNMTVSSILETINNTLHKQYSSFDEIFENKKTILSVDIFPYNTYSQKTDHYYTTFIPAETMKYILSYIQSIGTEKLNEHDYLFRKKNNQPLTAAAHMGIMKNISANARLDENKKKNQYNLFSSHQLRRYFFTKVMNCVGTTYADLWTGHKLSDVHSAYIRIDDSMIEKYRLCIESLSIESKQMNEVEKNHYELLKEKEELLLKYCDMLEKINILES